MQAAFFSIKIMMNKIVFRCLRLASGGSCCRANHHLMKMMNHKIFLSNLLAMHAFRHSLISRPRLSSSVDVARRQKTFATNSYYFNCENRHDKLLQLRVNSSLTWNIQWQFERIKCAHKNGMKMNWSVLRTLHAKLLQTIITYVVNSKL